MHTPDCRDAPSDMFLLKKACHRSDEVQVRKQVHKVEVSAAINLEVRTEYSIPCPGSG